MEVITTRDKVEKALEYLIADLDYDHYKNIRCSEDDGEDHFPKLVESFLADL